MKIIYVDDERYMLKRFSMECAQLTDVELEGCFDEPLKALEFAKNHHIDAAFLDVSMPQMTGLELSDRLREIYPGIVVVFISAYEEYMVDAFRNKNADYYILKPYSSADIVSVLERAELLSVRQLPKVTIETFGRFNIYTNGTLIGFSSKRAKEILAILVDRRGTSVNTKQLWNIMWENEEYDHEKAAALRKAIRRLRDTLKDAGIENLLTCTNGEYKINTGMVDCDYYRFLKGDSNAVSSFFGEYMPEYSWAESTTGLLIDMCPPDHISKRIIALSDE